MKSNLSLFKYILVSISLNKTHLIKKRTHLYKQFAIYIKENIKILVSEDLFDLHSGKTIPEQCFRKTIMSFSLIKK